MAKSTTTRQARFMALCAHGGGGGGGKGPPCPKGGYAGRANAADTGSPLLSKAAREINRTKNNQRFAPGLRAGAASKKTKA